GARRGGGRRAGGRSLHFRSALSTGRARRSGRTRSRIPRHVDFGRGYLRSGLQAAKGESRGVFAVQVIWRRQQITKSGKGEHLSYIILQLSFLIAWKSF